MGRRPGAGPRPRDPQLGRLVEDNQEALARLVTARSASPTRRRSARCRRSSTPATSSSARAAGCTARPCRARCPTSSCSPSATRSAWRRSSPPATSRSRCRPGTSCRRCSAATRWSGSRPSTPPRSAEALAELFLRGGAARRRAQPRARRRRRDVRRPRAARSSAGHVDKVGFTGSSDVGRRDRRAVRAPPADAVPGARRQEPDGGDGRRRRRPRRRGRAVQRLRDRGPALHVAGHRDRPRGVHDELLAQADAARSRRRRSATRARTSSTAR